MKYIGRLLGWILLAANLLWVCGLLFCAYSPYIDPVRHPVQSCAGLAFPVFLLGTVLFLLFWLVVYYRYALVALGGLLCCLPAIRTYCPLNFGREDAPESAIKFLSYNVMGFDADHPDTPDNPNLVLAYLRDSGADILCLQEYIRGGRLKQSHIDRVLSAYPYKDVRRVGKGGNHLACYSRYPILHARTIDYGSDFNGSVVYTLLCGGDTLTVVNNHLESNKLTTSDRETYVRMLRSPESTDVKEGSRLLLGKLAEATSIRSHQADTIARLIASQGRKRLIVCGDFNTSPISYAHRTIAEGLTDAFVESGFGLGISYHRNGFLFRIDNILISPDLQSYRCTVDSRIKNSDHYPIWCYVDKKP